MLRFLFLTYVLLFLTNWTEAQAPNPAFSGSPVSGCSPLVVSFTDHSTGTPTAWFWDFGNGATSTLQNPSTTYFTAGTYTVTLKVTNGNGSNSLTKTSYITVDPKPVANFKASDSVGCYPFPVQFTDLSQAPPGTTNTGWIWDLGDGTQATVQNPQKTYDFSGNYSITVKVTNDKGCWSSATKAGYIRVPGGARAGFSYTKSPSCGAPYLVNFTNASTGSGLLTYSWDFGDGTTSASTSPSHTYRNDGIYTVVLVAISSNGCRDTLRKDNLLNLHTVSTTFSAPGTACANNPVSFLNTSSDSALSTNWDFGDGTTSADLSPVKSFTTPGTYTVKLVQSYSACTDSLSKAIQVLAGPTAAFTADKKGSCQAPLSVRFQNTSTGAVSYSWDFGDGSHSTESSPSHTYTSLGSYTVTLVASNGAGCNDTLKMPGLITVAKPVISFDGLPVKGCGPYTHTFHANINTTDSVISYLWSFGEGSTSTLPSPSFTYTEQANYNVSLTITTAGGCKETYEMPSAIMIGKKPTVYFSPQPNEICAFQELHFTTVISDGDKWTWNFGDGGTASDPNPHYQYNDTGTFYVHLVVENRGCKDTFQFPHSIKVKPPIARFTAQTNCVNKLVVSLQNQSIGATSYQWDFGDGTISNATNPVHTFPAYGSYKIKLTVSNATCFHVTSKTVLLVKGIADFAVSDNSVCKGEAVTFTADNTDSASIQSYSWDFGDGSLPGTGNPVTKSYSKNGIFTVTLTVTDANGCVNSIVKPALVKTFGPSADFKMTTLVGCRGSDVTLTDASKDDGISKIASWQWDLGDGTLIHNTNSNPVRHLFTDIDTFQIRLLVKDTAGCASQFSLPLIVRKAGVVADFVSADTLSCPNAQVNFTNLSKVPNAYSSNWSFGDGSGAATQNPATTYKANGLYTVTLKISDGNGCADSITRKAYINIKSPAASFTVSSASSSCVPFRVQYTNMSSYYVSQVWDLSGGTSQLQNPAQYYNQPGIYLTKLTVTSPGGCTDTATKTIRVYSPADSRVAYLPLDGCKPLKVDLQAHSPMKMSFVWDFGDGTIINGDDTATKHVYNSFGDFVPKVIMRDTEGCVIAVTGLDTIHIKGATAKFGLDRQVVCDSGRINFIDSTIFNNPISSYTWTFGDGASSSQQEPSHQFSKPGLYNIALSVITQNQCVDTFRLPYPVRVVQSPQISIGGDSVVCAGQGLVHLGLFSRTDTSAVRWAWQFPNGKASLFQLPPAQVYKEAGNFTVQAIATNSSGCKDTAYRNILVNPLPSVTLPSVITTRQATPVLIPAVYSDEMKTYQWNLPEGLSCTTCPQPMAMPKLNTKYNVTFVDKNGCQNTGEVQVIVLCNNDNVFVPNTFSPNGDGSNDVFYVRGKGLNRVKSLRIFNRWGQIVFERTNFSVNDPSVGWNGSYNNAKPVPGVYVYQVEIFCDNSQVIRFESNLTLIQ